MSDSERKIADTQGQFLRAVADGREATDPGWENCRIVLTSERLVLVSDGKRQLSLDALEGIGDRTPYTRPAAPVTDYLPLELGEEVMLVSTSDQSEFETDLYRAVLDGAVLPVKHPAVEGGVVKDVSWTKGRLKVSDDALTVAVADGDRVTVERADIGDLGKETETVRGEERTVIAVEHTREDISVETHLAAADREADVLEAMLGAGAERNRADIDLSSVERQVVVALYSGVSPFDVPNFVGVDVERTEEIFDRLIDLEVISVRRERTDVRLTTKGRRVASEKAGDR